MRPSPNPGHSRKHSKQDACHFKPKHTRGLRKWPPNSLAESLATALHTYRGRLHALNPLRDSLRNGSRCRWPNNLRIRIRCRRRVRSLHQCLRGISCANTQRSSESHPVHTRQSNCPVPSWNTTVPNCASNGRNLSSRHGVLSEKSCSPLSRNRRRSWLHPGHPLPHDPLG